MKQQTFSILTPVQLDHLIQSSISAALEHLTPTTEQIEVKPQTEYLTRKETAKLLRISLTTLNDWSKKGIITAYRIGTRIRFKSNEINDFLTSLNSATND
jgi:excisionase family DNA binding protein